MSDLYEGKKKSKDITPTQYQGTLKGAVKMFLMGNWDKRNSVSDKEFDAFLGEVFNELKGSKVLTSFINGLNDIISRVGKDDKKTTVREWSLMGHDLVYVYECLSEGNKFLSPMKEIFCCDDCGSECSYLGSDSILSLPEDVIDFVSEEGNNGYKLKVIYTNGKKKLKRVKVRKVLATAAQKKAAENARKYAHTPSADAKRRKSFAARSSEGKLNIK